MRFLWEYMDYSIIVFIFALGNNTDAIMLGIESPRKPITGQFAKELREALVRARTGNLNQSEKNSILRSGKDCKKYNAVWK